jgi:sec-independent protein translocase protein TatA
LAVTGWEMIVVVGVLVVMFLWGPNKIPELARSIGQARKEFEKAQKELTTLPSTDSPQTSTESAPDDALISAAKGLGIPNEGKTRLKKQPRAKQIVSPSQAQNDLTTSVADKGSS